MELSPDEALVRRNGVGTILPVEEIRIGDLIIVRAGERIAMGAAGTYAALLCGQYQREDLGHYQAEHHLCPGHQGADPPAGRFRLVDAVAGCGRS